MEEKDFNNMEKVAVIIPLYGFWKDLETEQFTPEVLQVVLSRVKSETRGVYTIFVAEEDRTNPELVNIIAGRSVGGNVLLSKISPYANYSTYIKKGIRTALEDTKAEKIVIYNPWSIIQERGLDNLLDRINRQDVGIVSGMDISKIIPAENFDNFHSNVPEEKRDLELDLFGFTRTMAEILTPDGIDEEYRTHYFLNVDIWQSMYSKGFEIISTSVVPTYNFFIDWKLIEDRDDFELDKVHFTSKWGFGPIAQY
jgi:hypothetical protein